MSIVSKGEVHWLIHHSLGYYCRGSRHDQRQLHRGPGFSLSVPFTNQLYPTRLTFTVPAASTILTRIPGTTSSNPDGATFLDNLFGSGIYAPTNRIFSMALERREDVRTRSLFTIGETSDRLCPEPCSPNELAVIPHARLGATGFVHWRVSLIGITATTFDDPEDGEGPKNVTIPLGPSFADTSRTSPLAVLDSGGVQVLVSRRSYADSIYAAFGVSASGDGLCESSAPENY